MNRKRIRRSAMAVLFGGLVMSVAGNLRAQAADVLPPAQGYLGEIRRGPDGRLTAVPQARSTAIDTTAPKTTMRVGPNERITTLTEAARQAVDGEVIEIEPGDYRGQPAIWTQHKLLVRGAGERPVMVGEARSAEGKAIWIVRGGDVRIEHVAFRGALAADGRGAGIRVEQGHLTIVGCRFADNEVGVQTGDAAGLSLEIVDSEFTGDARLAEAGQRLIEVGAIARFELRGSRLQGRFPDALLRSRARRSRIEYNLLSGSAGELALPSGGVAHVLGNAIVQRPGNAHPALVAFGGDGPLWPDNALYLAHNTLVNDNFAGDFLKVGNDSFPLGAEIWQINNLLAGDGNFFPPALGRFEGNLTVSRAELIDYGGLPLRLTNRSPLRGRVRVPGSAGGVSLLPEAEFRYPAGTRAVQVGSALSPGAFQ